MTCLAKSPFCDGRVTPVGGPTFLHINSLARLAGSTRLSRDNQSMRECCWLGQRGQLFPHINACESTAGRVTLLQYPKQVFSTIIRALGCLSRPLYIVFIVLFSLVCYRLYLNADLSNRRILFLWRNEPTVSVDVPSVKPVSTKDFVFLFMNSMLMYAYFVLCEVGKCKF